MSQDQNTLSTKDETTSFPIRTLSAKTGVNSVTLRAWERRYGLLKPKRTEKGHRLYSDEDVARVDAIVRWMQQGVAVSKVRALLDREESIENVPPSTEWLEWQIELVSLSRQFNEDKIEHLYQQLFSQYPPLVVIKNWLLPSLEQLGAGVHARFCEAVISRCLAGRLASLKNQHTNAPSVLITGLFGERTLWCYMAAALFSDHGFACSVQPHMSSEKDWQALIEGLDPNAVVAFCETELVPKTSRLLASLDTYGEPVALIGASFWLAAHSNNITELGRVRVYSEALEGVLMMLKKLGVESISE
ncbi:MerR family transcriptional regulator [Marinomonas pollencensis]|uniref:DNA-binding transcriptional MerR regulator n=1 Tax=Marinomonas pollencensis TaxID=491954 RepID=A0A3E0DVN9_9GAMM|nr:MerR family transcriptional regulator [Marinomonas pollencensis]REG86978.1 DNA-binding transcriptional MerR regulator [Marinomonas pollencensis]